MEELVTLDCLFIDGTKIEANANKYSFVWKKTTEKFSAKLQEQIQVYFQEEIKVYYADEPESAPQKGLYMNERYQNLKAKECQALLSPQGRQIFAQRMIDVEPVFGQIKASLGYK
ncbi:hypothetical protein AT977_05470 [Streptococcus pneumoniae]|nr:hypothetical protein AT977_05470 [Streptococcus pneumoniae]